MPRLRTPSHWVALAAALAALGTSAVQLSGAVVGRGPDRPSAAVLAAFRRPDSVPHPRGDAPTAARLALGRALFFDPRVSRRGDVSCASCHVPALGWEDGRPTAVGTRGQVLGRHTPTVLNTAWSSAYFWDGRAESLEEQALGPVQAAGEMDMPLDTLVTRLRAVAGYRDLFARAYPGEAVSARGVARAIATFERTVVSGVAPFDRWVGGDESAMSTAAKRGFALFTGKARCAQCHSGWRFTDDSFHDIGVAGADSGRGKLVPGIEPLQFAFKTPTLRNARERAPYMHNGSERTLAQVIDLYDRGGRVRRPSLSPELRPLGLTADERRELLAFLETLSSADPVVGAPTLPR
jgi:cytochrome c peroxidase